MENVNQSLKNMVQSGYTNRSSVYEYTQVHDQIGDRKTAFCKPYRSKKCHPIFRRHSLINKLKKGNVADKPGVEAAAALKSLPSNVSLLSSRSSTTRTHSSTGNTKEFGQICFSCNEIRTCNSNAYNKGELGVCEFKSVGDRFMDAAKATDETNYLYIVKQGLIIHISGDSKEIFCSNEIPSIFIHSTYLQKTWR